MTGSEDAGEHTDDENDKNHECTGNVKLPEQEADGDRFRILQGEQHHHNQQPQSGVQFQIFFHRIPSLGKKGMVLLVSSYHFHE